MENWKFASPPPGVESSRVHVTALFFGDPPVKGNHRKKWLLEGIPK